ncbi:hypothetical protein [uncultured Gammaproteobacteria bacterium]|nr:hypothetical protein [uncultured Gammaproteobacteria bacterium]
MKSTLGILKNANQFMIKKKSFQEIFNLYFHGKHSNDDEEFFSTKNNNHKRVIFLPFESVEKGLKKLYDNNKNDNFFQKVIIPKPDPKGRGVYQKMKEKYSEDEIFEFVTKSDKAGVDKFKLDLQNFINQ